MFRNKLNDGRVVPVTHACSALHKSTRKYTLPKETLFEWLKIKIANIILKSSLFKKNNLRATNYRNDDMNTVYAMNKQFCAEKLKNRICTMHR